MGINLFAGQYFKSATEVAEAINYTKTDSRTLILKALGHYATYHKEGYRAIVIDSILDEPIPFINNEYVYEIGQVLQNKYSSFKVINREMKIQYKSVGHKTRVYTFQCLKCNNIFELNGVQIRNGAGCTICGKRRIHPGMSFYEKFPELVKYLKNPEDAKNYSYSSTKKFECICPKCGKEKEVSFNTLSQHGFSCANCSDGISYPNRFVTKVLLDCGVQLEREKSFKWSRGKIYDIYIPEYNMIIENHGSQHYEESFKFDPKASLANQKKNDALKEKLALKNGVKYYIILDCSKSTLDYIRNSIMNSSLPELLHFSEQDVDWEKCHSEACVSLEHITWELWNQGHFLDYICKELYISDTSAKAYIKKGIEAGECQEREHWQVKEELYTKKNFKPIYNITDGIYFSSRFEYEKAFPDFFPGKSGSFNLYTFINKNKLYKGKQLIYITQEEYNRVYEQSLSDPAVKVYGNPFDI